MTVRFRIKAWAESFSESKIEIMPDAHECLTIFVFALFVFLQRWKDNRGHHKTLKALCKNNGYYRTCNGEIFDLNYTLSEPMYKKMNEKNVFLTTFGWATSVLMIFLCGVFGGFRYQYLCPIVFQQPSAMWESTGKYALSSEVRAARGCVFSHFGLKMPLLCSATGTTLLIERDSQLWTALLSYPS